MKRVKRLLRRDIDLSEGVSGEPSQNIGPAHGADIDKIGAPKGGESFRG
jgi:hypothetical protein